MKKVLSLLAVAGLIAASSAAFGKTIVGSKHDLSVGPLANGTSTQICVYCHAPHNAAKSLPLWNRINPAGSLFTLYSGVNMQNVSFSSGFTADSTSLFCMSCHDGLTTMDAIHNAGTLGGGGAAGAVDATSATAADAYRTAGAGVFSSNAIGAVGNAALGSYNLTKTHPINFEVTTVDGQSDLFVGSAFKMGNLNQFPLFKSERSTTNRTLECGSCHAVHDSQNSPFLRATMDKSALCLGCHNK